MAHGIKGVKRHMDKGNENGLLGVGVLLRSETDGPSWLEEGWFLERTSLSNLKNRVTCPAGW